MTTLEQKALAFATERHGSQVRKYTGEPYITHPMAVAELVRAVPHSEAMIAAALLHDTVEDTDTTLEEVAAVFGAEVAELVGMLTDVSTLADGNRKTRKALDRAHSANASPAAKTVKLADLVDNSKSITAHDPNFAKVYLAEKRLLLEVLREGDASLFAMAKAFL